MNNEVHNLKFNQKSIAHATKWAFNAEFFAKMIVPITNMILARILAPDVFGMIAIVNMIVSFTDMITNAGFQKYLIQHNYESDIELKRDVSVVFYTNLFFSLLLWSIISLFNRSLALAVGCPGYGHVIAIACISLPITSFSSVQEALYMRRLEYKTLFYNRMIVVFLPFFITIPLAVLGFGYWSLVIGTICGNTAKAIFLTVKSEWRPTFYYSFILFRKMISFSLWSIFEAFTMWLGVWVDVFIISNAFGAHYTGLYRTTQITVSGIISVITAGTTTVLFSSLSRVQNNKEEFVKIFNSFQKNVGMIVLPLGVGIFVYSKFVTRVLLGTKWMEAAGFMGIWGLCTALVSTYGTFCREVYCAKGKPKISVLAQIFHLLFLIPICFFSRPLGFHFFIYSRSFASLQILIIHFIFMSFFMKMPVMSMIRQTLIPFFASILMGGVGIFFQFYIKGMILMLFSIIVCCCFYFFLLVLTPEYRNNLISLYNKFDIVKRAEYYFNKKKR